MKLKDLLLLPFKSTFRPPVLRIPVSTLQFPALPISMSIMLTSFALIVGGIVFCIVNGSPFIGAVKLQDGRYAPAWINRGMYQFGCEGVVIGSVLSLGSLSLILGHVFLENLNTEDDTVEPVNEKSKKSNNKQDDMDIDTCISNFGYTILIWMILAYLIYTYKAGVNRLSFFCPS